MTKLLTVFAALVAVFAASTSAAPDQSFPKRIDLPDGFRPEGIAIAGQRFFTGSLGNGAVYSGNLRTGRGAILVQPQAGRVAVGMKADRGRLFVAGGDRGNGFVYSATSGARSRLVPVLDERQLRQRRRRHEGRRLVHGLVQARPVPRAVGSGRTSGRTVHSHDGSAHGRLRAQSRRLQRERDRGNRERDDARHRPVGHRQALHRHLSRRDTGDRARGWPGRAERRRHPARGSDAVRRPEPAEHGGEDRDRSELALRPRPAPDRRSGLRRPDDGCDP